MNWNKERLIEKFMDNAALVTSSAGISPLEPPTSHSQPPICSSTSSSTRALPTDIRPATRRLTTDSVKSSKSKRGESPLIARSLSSTSEPFVCPICFDDSQTKTLRLSCDHTFCASCWNEHATSKICGEQEIAIRCMAEGCSLVAPDLFVRSILEEDMTMWDCFHELVIRHFVASNPNLKYCPYPSCTYVVSCPSASSKSSLATVVPTVACGASATHKFCFGCPIDGDHRPVICGVAEMWLKKCRDDSETANWIMSNTKECSECQSTIEKNVGCKYVAVKLSGSLCLIVNCSHMTCKKCKYEFCWVCMRKQLVGCIFADCVECCHCYRSLDSS
jgi:ariadne-1